MSQSAPGWYQDHDDPRLARWWDGERWTEHTLVLADQDWTTEPPAPAGSTRFPVDTGSVTAVEGTPESYEEDIYAPIRDPWGEDEPVVAPVVDPPTTAWSDEGAAAWDDSTVAGAATISPTISTGWDEDRWVAGGPSRPGVQSWPQWARIALPVGGLAVLLILLVATGVIGGSDDDPITTNSTSTTEAPSLADAADAALRAAGTGPFTASTFTTLIPLTCEAADDNDPAALTERILLLSYDTETISKLVAGLRAGTREYCPDKMAAAPTLLSQVESAALTGGTTSTSAVTVPESTTTTKPTTGTTKKPTTTTKPPTTTTTAPTTTTTQATTTSSTPEPTTTSTEPGP